MQKVAIRETAYVKSNFTIYEKLPSAELSWVTIISVELGEIFEFVKNV